MRKQFAAARRLPFQTITESGFLKRNKKKIVLSIEMLFQSSVQLRRCREVDEAVALIIRGACERRGFMSLGPLRGRNDFEHQHALPKLRSVIMQWKSLLLSDH